MMLMRWCCRGVSRLWALLLAGLCGCTGVPAGVTPVQPFDITAYMGQWYEVARLDNRFERGLSQVSATYTLQANGEIEVVNRGFSAAENRWQQAVGVAKFANSAAQHAGRAELKVSFFGPFYASYNVVALSPDQQLALVVGRDLSYAWVLSRSASPDPAQCAALVRKAQAIGIAPSTWLQLIPCQAKSTNESRTST